MKKEKKKERKGRRREFRKEESPLLCGNMNAGAGPKGVYC